MDAAEKSKNLKLLALLFLGTILGALGVSKSDLANKVPWLKPTKIASVENSDAQMCDVDAAAKKASLFVSCTGFLE